ncbi:Uncharacterised protein [uncultured archaeon]|nr:Uncharacterised protein [uncultured archaeon]
MDDVRGEHLQGHGSAKVPEYLYSLVFRSCHTGAGGGYPQALQNSLALMLHQVASACGLRPIYDISILFCHFDPKITSRQSGKTFSI